MTKALILSATALSMGLATAPVFAGGLAAPVVETTPVVAPAPAPMVGSVWDGWYGGAQIGGATLDDGPNDDDGVYGGLHLGWNNSYNKFVYGFELDANAADATLGGNDVNHLARLKAKAGYDLGRSMIYATAGGAQLDLDGAGDDLGYTAGLGYDYMVTERTSVGLEANYHFFDDFNDSGNDIEGTTVGAKVSFHF